MILSSKILILPTACDRDIAHVCIFLGPVFAERVRELVIFWIFLDSSLCPGASHSSGKPGAELSWCTGQLPQGVSGKGSFGLAHELR